MSARRGADPSVSTNEIIATFIARDLVDGERVFVGTNLPVLRAGVLLGHLHHGPNMRVRMAQTWTNLFHVPVIEHFELVADWRGARWAEAFSNDNDVVLYQKSRRDAVFFVGALQVDRYGNSNLIGRRAASGGLAMRGPGAIATPTNSTHAGRFYLFLTEHSPRVFVERCDFVSAVGWGEGGEDGRRKLGLPGGGPRYCVTPLGVLDFEEGSKRLRLKSTHPGATVDQVVSQTAFPLVVPNHVEVTAVPTPEELAILRDRVDPLGFLRS